MRSVLSPLTHTLAFDAVVAGSNPLLNALTALVETRAGKSVLLAQDAAPDPWPYALFADEAARHLVERAGGLTGAPRGADLAEWAEWLFAAISAQISASPSGDLVLLGRPFALEIGRSSATETVVFARPQGTLPASEAAGGVRAGLAAASRATLEHGRMLASPRHDICLFARRVVVTSAGIGNAVMAANGAFAGGSPLVTPLGTARWSASGTASDAEEAIRDVLTALAV